jgi:hypothetical protein
VLILALALSRVILEGIDHGDPTPGYIDLADLLSIAGPYDTFLDYLSKTKT